MNTQLLSRAIMLHTNNLIARCWLGGKLGIAPKLTLAQ